MWLVGVLVFAPVDACQPVGHKSRLTCSNDAYTSPFCWFLPSTNFNTTWEKSHKCLRLQIWCMAREIGKMMLNSIIAEAFLDTEKRKLCVRYLAWRDW